MLLTIVSFMILAIWWPSAVLSNNIDFDPQPYLHLAAAKEEYELPGLPFSQFSDMEPNIDRRTMEVHILGHVDSYRIKTNMVLAKWRREQPADELARKDLLAILRNLARVPEPFRSALRNVAGGFVNHVFYFATMAPNPQQQTKQLPDRLAEQLLDEFGSVSKFKEQLTNRANLLFGSGYVWLVRDEATRRLSVEATANQDSPLSAGKLPLLCLDVWEHAYYLAHQHRRARYVALWWHTVDWTQVDALDQFWAAAGPALRVHDEF